MSLLLKVTVHTNIACSSIEAVLNELFDDRSQVDDHLTGLNLMNLRAVRLKLIFRRPDAQRTDRLSMGFMVAMPPSARLVSPFSMALVLVQVSR